MSYLSLGKEKSKTHEHKIRKHYQKHIHSITSDVPEKGRRFFVPMIGKSSFKISELGSHGGGVKKNRDGCLNIGVRINKEERRWLGDRWKNMAIGFTGEATRSKIIVGIPETETILLPKCQKQRRYPKSCPSFF